MRSPAARADMRLTYDDFVLFPDDGKRHEIIDGEHVVTPSPNVRHQRLVRRLLVEIELYLKANPRAGEVFSTPLDVVLSHFDVVAPDLLFVAGDQTDILTEKNIQGGTGVRESWLVDPERDTVQVFRPSPEGKLARVVEVTSEDGDVLTTPLLPGCQIALRDLFRNGR